MNYEVILALDPSGNFTEGKGTTGYCVFDCKQMKILKKNSIKAKDFVQKGCYWDEHLQTIEMFHMRYGNKMIVVIEDFLLYGHKAEAQTNSRMETSRLIGVIEHFCWKNQIPIYFQPALLVKTRWADNILEHKGYIKKKGKKYNVNRHIRDSIRHAVHFATFKNIRKEKKK